MSRIKKYRMKAIPSAISEKGGYNAQFIGDGYTIDARKDVLPGVNGISVSDELGVVSAFLADGGRNCLHAIFLYSAHCSFPFLLLFVVFRHAPCAAESVRCDAWGVSGDTTCGCQVTRPMGVR